MGSVKGDNSVTSSMFIPGWVKNRFDNPGFDPSALSPPNHDSEFFYVKFPETKQSHRRSDEPIIDRINNTIHVANQHDTLRLNQPDRLIKPKVIKAMGLDDSVVAASEGSGSVVAVARQILAGKPPVRGFTTDDTTEIPTTTYLRQRRNSKSLPASPLATPETSPRAKRKNPPVLQHRLTTGSIAAIAAPTLNDAQENIERRSQSSWLLSNLFTRSRENMVAVRNQQNSFAPEVKVTTGLTVADDAAKKSSDTLKASDLTTVGRDRTMYMKKRAEVRELNFISPISM